LSEYQSSGQAQLLSLQKATEQKGELKAELEDRFRSMIEKYLSYDARQMMEQQAESGRGPKNSVKSPSPVSKNEKAAASSLSTPFKAATAVSQLNQATSDLEL